MSVAFLTARFLEENCKEASTHPDVNHHGIVDNAAGEVWKNFASVVHQRGDKKTS